VGGYVKYALNFFFFCVLYILPVFASYWWNLWAHQLESIARFLCLHFKFLFCNGWCRASDISRDYDGACLQMRMSYSPAAHLFLFLVQWTDCHLAGALGLLRILIYKVELCSFGWDCTFFSLVLTGSLKTCLFPIPQVYVDGTTTMTTHERKASIREFYGKFLSSKYLCAQFLYYSLKLDPPCFLNLHPYCGQL